MAEIPWSLSRLANGQSCLVLMVILVRIQFLLGHELRLVNEYGEGRTYGRLEVLYNDTWGTVCDEGFTVFDAEVACRQLSLDFWVIDYYKGAYFGKGAGPVWLDGLGCQGMEASLEHCSHPVFGDHNCSHHQDVGVSCGMTNVELKSTSSASFYAYIAVVVILVMLGIGISIHRRRKRSRARNRHRLYSARTPEPRPAPGLDLSDDGPHDSIDMVGMGQNLDQQVGTNGYPLYPTQMSDIGLSHTNQESEPAETAN